MHQALEFLRRLADPGSEPVQLPQDEFQRLHDAFERHPSILIDEIERIATHRTLGPEIGAFMHLMATMFGEPGSMPPRGLLARLAMRGPTPERFASLLNALDGLARTPAELEEGMGTFGRHTLVRKVACTSPEECHRVAADGCFDRELFLRTFPRERLTDALIARLKAWALLTVEGTTQIFDVGCLEHRPYVLSDVARGIDLRRLTALRPSLPIVLALLSEGLATLEKIHATGTTHGHLTAGRIRIEPLGGIKLCFGTSELAESESAGEDLCTLARLMLHIAVDDAKSLDVLKTNDREALIVTADRLEELHPELDELIASVLGERRSEDLFPLMAEHVAREEALSLIGALVEGSRV